MSRRYVRKAERAIMYERQKGLCSCGCGKSLDSGPAEVEHTLPVWLGGDDELHNMTLMLSSCHLVKTTREATARAKVKRLQKRARGERPRARRGPPLRGRGFPKGPWKRKVNGQTVARQKSIDS